MCYYNLHVSLKLTQKINMVIFSCAEISLLPLMMDPEFLLVSTQILEGEVPRGSPTV